MKRFSILVFAFILVASFVFIEAEPIIEHIGDTTLFIWHDNKLSWEDALRFCFDKNTALLSLETAEKNEKVNKVLRDRGFVNHQGMELHNRRNIGDDYIYWTSGNDRNKEGQFIWETTGDKFTYTNWLPTMPDNWQGDENCVEISYRELGKWNDTRCRYPRYFICERNISEDESPVVPDDLS